MKVMERIDRQVDQVTDLVKQLEKKRSYRGKERLIQLTIQSLLNLGPMVIAALGGRTPERCWRRWMVSPHMWRMTMSCSNSGLGHSWNGWTYEAEPKPAQLSKLNK